MDWHAPLIKHSTLRFVIIGKSGLGTGPAPRALCGPGLHRRGGRHDGPIRRRPGTEASNPGYSLACWALWVFSSMSRALGRRYVCAQCLATKRLIRIEGAIFIAPVNDRFTFNQHRERLN